MNKKLPKLRENRKLPVEEAEKHENEDLSDEDDPKVSFIPKMLKKDALFVTFNGIVESGTFGTEQSLVASCSLTAGLDWTRISGEKQFISQIASSNGDDLVWNLPFQVTYEASNLMGWPQLTISLYGTDFLGRQFVRGYGNVHLPTSTGRAIRKMMIFQPLPQSVISGIFGFITGCVAQYKDTEKTLTQGEGREVTRVKSMGEVKVVVETVKYNFEKFGFE